MYSPRDLLIINVGFIVHQTVGYSRDFPLEAPFLRLPPDLELTDFSGIARVTRTAQGLLVQAILQATMQAECVRCLETTSQTLKTDFTELYAFTRDSITESGLLLPDNGKIDLTAIAREEMLLAVPISPLCKAECKGLCPICGENLNLITCTHEEENDDTPLKALNNHLGGKE